MVRLGIVLSGLVLFATAAQAADPSLSPQANAAYMAAFARKPGVVVRPSGLEYRIVHSGFGARPSAFDSVTVNYRGSLINGNVFDATEPGFPAEFTVNGVIPGWTEALELMREGDDWELVIPASLAYGTRGAPPAIPPNQALVFDVQLIKVTPAQKEPDKDQGDDSSQ